MRGHEGVGNTRRAPICNTLHEATDAEAQADKLAIEKADKQAKEREAQSSLPR